MSLKTALIALPVLTLALAGTAAAHPRHSINQRTANQNRRIANGIATGRLNEREAANLDRREARIEGQVARDRATNGGRLTPREHRRIEGELNRTSRAISRDERHPRY